MKTHPSSTVATICHKTSFIVSLTKSDGTSVSEHDQKANILWIAFKERLGSSEFTNMAQDFNTLLTQHDLEQLDLNFSQEEIDLVIKFLPNSHAPRPDGFNGLFIKKNVGVLLRMISSDCSMTSATSTET